MLAAVGLLHDLQRRVPGQALGEQRGALHRCRRELVAPPLVRDLVRHHREREVDAARIVLRVEEREPLLVRDVDRVGVQGHAVAGVLDEPELAVRVRAELLGVVVERGLDAADHAVHVPGVAGVVEDLDRDVVPARLRARRRRRRRRRSRSGSARRSRSGSSGGRSPSTSGAARRAPRRSDPRPCRRRPRRRSARPRPRRSAPATSSSERTAGRGASPCARRSPALVELAAGW